MKRTSIILLVLAICFTQLVYADSAKVRLKNGTLLVGDIISLDPTSEIRINVAGYETKINIEDVESVEKINEGEPQMSTLANVSPNPIYKPDARPTITHKGEIKVKSRHKTEYVESVGSEGQSLIMEFVSKDDKTLKVIRHKKGYSIYFDTKWIFPEYVDINGVQYSVVAIGKKAFHIDPLSDEKLSIEEIILPSTLKIIEDEAFHGIYSLKNIIIPDGVEIIGKAAFRRCGSMNKSFEHLYIPTSVKFIGEDAFRHVGRNTSPRGFYQGTITSIPLFINPHNCTKYGIDDNAVEEYLDRLNNN